MDLKQEVRRRIAELTQLAYERGYREGAQSALAEIENATGEDLADRLKGSSASLRVLRKTGGRVARRATAAKKPKRQERKSRMNGGMPKAALVQRCIHDLFAAKGEARRDEILAAARGENPRITGQDVLNGIRTLTRRGEVRVDPKEKGRLLPPSAPAAAAG